MGPPESGPNSAPRGPALSAAAVAARVLSSSVSFGGELSARFAGHSAPHAPSVMASLLFLAGDFFRAGDDLSVRWYAASVDGCPGWGTGRVLRLEPCARVTGGLLTAADHNVSNPTTSTRWWGSGGVVLHAELRPGGGQSGGFWLRAEVGLDFPIVERRFTVGMTSPQPAGQTASISPTFAVGLVHGL